MQKKKTNKEIYIVCDNIRSLYNVGSIFRTSDGAGFVKKIFLTGMTGYPKQNDPLWTQTKKISKTSLGAEKYISWEYVKNPIFLIKKLKKQKINIYTLENNTENSINYLKTRYKFPLALVIGHEIIGINKEIIKISDKTIYLPMRGKKESLNVASAFAIAIYKITEKI